ncbi:MAG: acyl-CoA dehydrogenase family protein [Myxococcota bacterium]
MTASPLSGSTRSGGDSALLASAREAFGAAAELASAMTGHLAGAVAERGVLDEERLGARQPDAFWLSVMLSRLQAARSILGYAQRRETPLAVALARIFVAEILQDLAAELTFKAPHWGLAGDLVSRILHKESVALFVATSLDPVYYEHVGDLVLEEKGTEYGLDPERELIRQQFRRFTDQKVVPLASGVHREDGLVPKEILEAVSELGCFGLSIPERYGGLQPDDRPDNLGMCVVTEELSRGSLGIAGSLITRPEILSKALLKGGTDEQRETWLPRLATGETLCAVAVTEPDFGSDVAGLKVMATPVEDGWVLNGQKTWCTFAGQADVLMVLARSDADPKKGHRGLSIFLAEKPRFDGHKFEFEQGPETVAHRPGAKPGKLTARAIDTIGYRGMHSFDVFFEDFFVPEHGVLGGLGGIGKGFYYQMEGFAGGRLQTAARATGVMQAALEAATRYSKERRVFGLSIANYGLTRWKLARMAMLTQVARQFTYDVAALIDIGKGQVEASMVKLWASKQAEWVTREAMQLHGGMGYAEEYDVSRYFVDARVFSIFEGAEEVLALKVVARQVLQRWLEERREASQ